MAEQLGWLQQTTPEARGMKRSICLLGRDYPELGPLGIAALPDGGALALSRGALPKPYPHQDPNEDGALLVAHGTTACCWRSPMATTESRPASSRSPPRSSARRSWSARAASAFRTRVAELVTRVAQRLPASAARSRTCLVLARVVGRQCEFASFGDSCLLRSEPVRAGQPHQRAGTGARARHRGGVSRALVRDASNAPQGERIALVTDGVTNFAPGGGGARPCARGRLPSDPVGRTRAGGAGAARRSRRQRRGLRLPARP